MCDPVLHSSSTVQPRKGDKKGTDTISLKAINQVPAVFLFLNTWFTFRRPQKHHSETVQFAAKRVAPQDSLYRIAYTFSVVNCF